MANHSAIRFEAVAEGAEEAPSAIYDSNVVNFADLEEEVGQYGTAVGITKRAKAGLQSLADSSATRFETLSVSKVYGNLPYEDYDIVFRVRTLATVDFGGIGRQARITFTCAVHVTGSGRIEPTTLYVKDFEDDTVLEVKGNSDDFTTTFKGDMTSLASLMWEGEALARGFMMELAFRGFVDDI